MKYELKIDRIYFDKISKGEKTVEGRLFDERRRGYLVGDVLEIMARPDFALKMTVRIVGLRVYPSFKKMIEDVGVTRLGFRDETIEEVEKIYHQFYSIEDEEKYGALAIFIERGE